MRYSTSPVRPKSAIGSGAISLARTVEFNSQKAWTLTGTQHSLDPYYNEIWFTLQIRGRQQRREVVWLESSMLTGIVGGNQHLHRQGKLRLM